MFPKSESQGEIIHGKCLHYYLFTKWSIYDQIMISQHIIYNNLKKNGTVNLKIKKKLFICKNVVHRPIKKKVKDA